MEYDQIQINRQVLRIPLATKLTNRNSSLGKDAFLKNCYIETTANGKKVVRTRAGYTTVDELDYASGTATGQGLTFYSGRYYAIANNSIYRLGASQNSVSSGVSWLTSGTSSTFGPRYGHSVVFFKGKIYSIGGTNGTATNIGDIWSSMDGFEWAQVVPSAPWGSRTGMAVAVLGETLYAMGGLDDAGIYHNDVWYSSDGENWTLVNSSASWGLRYGARAIGFNGALLVLGGYGGALGYYADVWSSTNGGETWIELATPTWSARYNFGLYVNDGYIVVAGGLTAAGFDDEVYDSADAQSWRLRTGAAWGSSGRSDFGYCVYNNKLWALGGLTTGPTRVAQVWYSSDGGAVWTQTGFPPGWTARNGAQAVVCNTPLSVSTIQAETMFLLGGSTGSAVSDTYYATLDTVGSSSFAIATSAPTYEPFNFSQVTPSNYLVFKNRYDAWVLYGNTVSQITDPAFPTRTVPGIVYLNRRIYVMDPNGFIYGSDLDSPLSFSSLNFIEAEYEPDKGIAIAKYLNYVVALGERTLQFFYDTGAYPGSALAPQQNMVQRIGCINGYTVVSMEGLLVFVGKSDVGGRAVYVIDSGQPKRISTEEVERLLATETEFDDDSSTFFSTGYGVSGHKFYMLNLPTHELTITYDFTENEWHIEQYNGSNVMPFSGYVTDSGGNYFQIATGQYIGSLYDGVLTDDGATISISGTTDNVDFGTALCKYQRSVTRIGDRTGGTFIIEWSDDDYQTWSTAVGIAANQAKAWTHRGGRFYQRAYRWYTTSPFTRLEALEIQVDFGNV